MISYFLLFIPIAVIAYMFGSLSTLLLASNFVFRYNLKKFGTGNIWLANFRRVYGWKGGLKLLAVELVKDIVPILLGGLIMGIKGHPEAGRAVAGFCMVMGRLYPVYYSYHGSHATMTMIVTAAFYDISLGIVVAVVVLAALFATKYISLATILGAVFMIIASLLILEDKMLILLVVFTAALVVIKHIPSLGRIAKGKEEKFALKEDLSYKFDEKF